MTGNAFRWTTSASILVGLLAFASVQTAQAQTKDFNVPAQSATTGIPEFARQAGIQILVSEPLVRGKRVSAVTGSYSIDKALLILLKGTGLTATSKDGTTYTVAASQESPTTRNSAAASGAISQYLPVDDSSPGAPNSGNGAARLEEIIVTAQKREERIQDVPVPVTVISADALVKYNQLRLQDYYITVPALSVVPVASTVQNLSIRGITTGSGTNPTVGITVDDVPYGSSTGFGGSGSVPDFDPGDLARVEILRGPQGTLYGASSMGGLVKYVTVDPAFGSTSARLEAGMSNVYNGADLGYDFRGSANVPLSSALAVRASAFTRVDPGYIDNVQTGEKGVNRARVSGGRLSALWQPWEDLSMKLSALYQDYSGDGTNDVFVPTAGYVLPPLGDLQQSYIPGTGGYDRRFEDYSLVVKAKLGHVDLIGVSGYNTNSTTETLDATYILGSLAQAFFNVAGAPISVDSWTHKFTQEVRVSSPIGEKLEWLAGAFYTHEDSPGFQSYLAANANTGAVAGEFGYYDTASTLTEYAAFADLTFHLTNQFDVQIGGREAQIKQTASQTTGGLLYGAVTTVTGNSKNNAFTYLITPQYKVSPDLMVYARLASGYRAGGPNTVAGEPSAYKPDKTQNYEVGVKSDFLDHNFSIDASLYYIDWKDIQVLVQDLQTFQTWTINANRAKSQGMELSTTAKPMKDLTVVAWIAYDDAVLSAGFPPTSTTYGVAGDRLPYTSRVSGNLSLQQDFRLSNGITWFVGGSVSYVGDRIGVFGTQTAPQRQVFPAYARTDLRAGAAFDSWSANVFVTNLTDKRAATEGGLGSFPPFAFNYIQPRTIGLNIVKSF